MTHSTERLRRLSRANGCLECAGGTDKALSEAELSYKADGEGCRDALERYVRAIHVPPSRSESSHENARLPYSAVAWYRTL